jgi:hypothetical protein
MRLPKLTKGQQETAHTSKAGTCAVIVAHLAPSEYQRVGTSNEAGLSHQNGCAKVRANDRVAGVPRTTKTGQEADASS